MSGQAERARRWKKAGLTATAIRARERLIVEEEARNKPSRLFARNLRAARELRGLSQRQLAELMSAAGHPMTKVAITRLEADKLERKLTLDEALALSWVLEVAPMLLLTPEPSEHLFPVASIGLGKSETRNWLTFGNPGLHDVKGQRVKTRLALVQSVERQAQNLVDAIKLGDSDDRNVALVALAKLVVRHKKEIDELEPK
jgi:transcriptional regulator with XRE-family HTH domain